MEAIFVVAVILIAFLIYGIPFGVTKISPDEFFLMNKDATVEQYNDTTVAYNLQVSVTIYFVYWGYKYGLSNVFFIITWFLGLLVFAAAAPSLAEFVARTDSRGSFFQYVANSSAPLRRYMGALFAVSLTGLLFTELYFTAQFVESLTLARNIAEPAPHIFFWVSFAGLAFLVLWYCSLGGMRKVVETNTWQLSIAYIGSAVFIAGLAQAIAANAGASAFRFVYIGMALLYLLMAIAPGLIAFFETKTVSLKKLSHVTFWSLLLSAFISAIPLLMLPAAPTQQALAFPKPLSEMLFAPYGWAPILGFGIINLIWQFSDYTAYHRLSLLQLPEDRAAQISRIRESIYATMLNSPLTWALGIFAGMAIYAAQIIPPASEDVFADFVRAAAAAANADNTLITIGLCGLAAFLATIMLSTVDTGFMSVAQIVVRDILQSELSPVARVLVNVIMIAIMFAFAILLVAYDIKVLIFLSAVYSWGLIFGASGLARLFGVPVPPLIAFIGLTSGAVVGAWSTFNPLNLPDLVALVFPSVAAIVVSSVITLLALIPYSRRAK